MLVTELETFVQKFHQLWKAGLSAHLDLESHASGLDKMFLVHTFKFFIHPLRSQIVLLANVAEPGVKLPESLVLQNQARKEMNKILFQVTRILKK